MHMATEEMLDNNGTWTLFSPPPPPPSRWRAKRPEQWGVANWAAAWRESKLEAAEMHRWHRAARLWADVLRGDKHTARWWENETIPDPLQLGNGKVERIGCRRRPTPPHVDHPECVETWPERSCVAYVFGIGELTGHSWRNAWGLPIAAAKRGCRVHAYDPTTRLRKSHIKRATQAWPNGLGQMRGDVSFHFAGLGDGHQQNSTNSYGAVDGTTLATFSELASRNVQTERAPNVVQIGAPRTVGTPHG